LNAIRYWPYHERGALQQRRLTAEKDMPLSDPSERELLHLRDTALRGYRRSDGLYDVEARLIDRKTYSFPNEDRGQIDAGEALHDMWVRVTVDGDLLIHASEASTEQGPFSICPRGAETFPRLSGLKIGAGFLKAANERLRGVAGCASCCSRSRR
jgi:hypothetical protein